MTCLKRGFPFFGGCNKKMGPTFLGRISIDHFMFDNMICIVETSLDLPRAYSGNFGNLRYS